MLINILRPVLYHDRLGTLKKGQTVEVPDKQAQEWVAKGWAVTYQTKVMQDRPYRADGREALLSASQVAQASPSQTLSESESGDKNSETPKRRGRPRKEQSS